MSMDTLDPRRYSKVIDLGDGYYFIGISERLYKCKGNYVEYPIGWIVKEETKPNNKETPPSKNSDWGQTRR